MALRHAPSLMQTSNSTAERYSFCAKDLTPDQCARFTALADELGIQSFQVKGQPEHGELWSIVSGLTPADFATLLLLVDADTSILPGPAAPMAERADAFLLYYGGHEDLIRRTIERI